jgi:hypothetical protein
MIDPITINYETILEKLKPVNKIRKFDTLLSLLDYKATSILSYKAAFMLSIEKIVKIFDDLKLCNEIGTITVKTLRNDGNNKLTIYGLFESEDMKELSQWFSETYQLKPEYFKRTILIKDKIHCYVIGNSFIISINNEYSFDKKYNNIYITLSYDSVYFLY